MDPLMLERLHGSSSPVFCPKQCQRWMQTSLLRTLSSLQYLQRRWFHNLGIKPVPMLNYPHSKLVLLCPVGPPLVEVVTVVPHSHTMQLSKEPGSVFTATCPQGLADCTLVCPKPSLLLAKPAPCLQPLPLGYVVLLSPKFERFFFLSRKFLNWKNKSALFSEVLQSVSLERNYRK